SDATKQAKLINNPSTVAPAEVALAQVISGDVDTKGAILQLGAVTGGLAQPAHPSSTIVAPAIGMQVAKSGRTTGLTCDLIEATNMTVHVRYESTYGS